METTAVRPARKGAILWVAPKVARRYAGADLRFEYEYFIEVMGGI